MVKASIVLTNGTKITIEGSASEVQSMITNLQDEKAQNLQGSLSNSKTPRKTSPKHPKKDTLLGIIGGLREEGFFKKPKEFKEIKLALEERGHFYPRTSFPKILLKLVRSKQLRRLKNGKNWTYVG